MFWNQKTNSFYLWPLCSWSRIYGANLLESNTLVVISSIASLNKVLIMIASSIIIYSSSSSTHSFPYFIQLKYLYIFIKTIKVMPNLNCDLRGQGKGISWNVQCCMLCLSNTKLKIHSWNMKKKTLSIVDGWSDNYDWVFCGYCWKKKII